MAIVSQESNDQLFIRRRLIVHAGKMCKKITGDRNIYNFSEKAQNVGYQPELNLKPFLMVNNSIVIFFYADVAGNVATMRSLSEKTYFVGTKLNPAT
jgi:hypothetical protein